MHIPFIEAQKRKISEQGHVMLVLAVEDILFVLNLVLCYIVTIDILFVLSLYFGR